MNHSHCKLSWTGWNFLFIHLPSKPLFTIPKMIPTQTPLTSLIPLPKNTNYDLFIPKKDPQSDKITEAQHILLPFPPSSNTIPQNFPKQYISDYIIILMMIDNVLLRIQKKKTNTSWTISKWIPRTSPILSLKPRRMKNRGISLTSPRRSWYWAMMSALSFHLRSFSMIAYA